MEPLVIKWSNPEQREFYYSTIRNQCFSSGFNSGKTFVGCLKILTLLTTFPRYRVIIARQTYADLKKTTMQTFFKLCPKEMIARHNEQDGYTELFNGSTINWMHLDNVDESSLRGLEVNSILVDQAEEIQEKVYDVLDSRVGRWDEARIPPELLRIHPDWPKNELTGKFIAPSYLMLLCNPDTQFHFIFRRFHPDSLERKANHFYIEREWDASLGSIESYHQALSRDEEWVNKYVRGKWGFSSAQIHNVREASLIHPDTPKFEQFMADFFRKGNLFRSLDHGETSPTCCLWAGVYNGVFVFYREYYQPNALISDHRQNIADLSQGESYSGNYADPSIFQKESKSKGGFWSVADEYLSKDLPGPTITWVGADNNEFATRNRINELLRPSDKFKHPITGEMPAPGIYFICRHSELYPFGCYQAVNQLRAQRRKMIGYFEGKAIYSDERDEKVLDHAYDPIRYFISMHTGGKSLPLPKPKRNTFAYFDQFKGKFRQPKPGSLINA